MKIKTYFSNVFDGMAKGLFASLIIGTIIKQMGVLLNIELLQSFGEAAQFMMGPAIGASIALKLEAKPFTLIACITAGTLGAGTIFLGSFALETAPLVQIGEPMGAFIASAAAASAGKFLEGRSKFDMLIVPAIVVIIGGFIGIFVSPFISLALNLFGGAVNNLTELHTLPMSILVAVIIGITLTSPISSAAICISININGIAAGAALAGCCAQMIGFASMSYKENKGAGLLTQGLGTSMVQMPNIIKNPWIWLPPIVTSAITGPLSAMVFKMETNSVGAGMGTSGLVGQFSTFAIMGISAWPGIILLHFIIPAFICLSISEIMQKKGIIKQGDMKL